MSCSTSRGKWKHPSAMSGQDRFDVGGKRRNIAIQLVSRVLLLPVLPYLNACSIIFATHHLYIFVRSQALGTLGWVSYPGRMYRCNPSPFERNRTVNWMNIVHFKPAVFLFSISVKPLKDRDIVFIYSWNIFYATLTTPYFPSVGQDMVTKLLKMQMLSDDDELAYSPDSAR